MGKISESAQRSNPVRAARVITDLDEFLKQTLPRSADSGPKYAQLHAALVQAIESGVVTEGDKLPSEIELTSMTPFSLGTVQKALKALMEDGLVVRKIGAGTIVRQPDERMKQPLHCRFSGPDGVFLPVFPTLVNRQSVDETGPWTSALPENARIVRLDREIRISDAFTMVTRFYVDALAFPFFMEKDFAELHTENFKSLMQKEANIVVAAIDHKLTFIRPDPDIAARIGVAPSDQILKISVVTSITTGEAIYYQEFFIPPNDLDLAIESRLQSKF
ncbi:GntR family transcriptional regulator [Alphaproteobacteria bacterium HT1-32]|nr:GntR family transcriptional regulator [Alphaproteobacteria bacterium HT1-32]